MNTPIDWDVPDSEWGGHIFVGTTDDLGGPKDREQVSDQ